MQKILLPLLFMVMVLSLYSQEQLSLSGTIVNSKTGEIVENAEIIIQNYPWKSVSDDSGVYKFYDIPAGEYTLRIFHMSYEDFSTSVQIKQNQTVELKATLQPKIEALEEVVIEESKLGDPVISRLPYMETQFVKEQIRREATRDVTDYLRSSKNINGIRKGGTQLDPVVRGFKYSQLNVRLNGGQKIEGGCPNRMDPATAHVEIEDVESIEVIKGPFALKYGPMFGGMINMNTEIPPHLDSTYVHIKALMAYESNWNGNKQHLNVFGGYKGVFYSFSGGYKKYGNYKDGNGKEVKSEFTKYNYKGQLGYLINENHQLSLNYEESKGRDIRFPTLPMDERSDDTRLISMNYKGDNISRVFRSIRFMMYHSDVSHEMDNKNRPFSDTVVAVSNIDALNRGFRLETGIKVGSGNLAAGVDFEDIRKDGDRVKNMITQPGLPVKTEKLWNNAEISNLGIFAEYTYDLKSWKFIGALRLDFNTASSDDISITHPMQGEIYYYGTDSIKSEYTNFSMSLGVTKKLTKNWSLSLALGRGVRSPDMTERFIILLPIGYDKYDYLGNPQLKPEANNQLDLTVKYASRKFGLMQINGFYSLINDFITGKRLSPAEQKPLSKDVLGVKQFYNAGNARVRGFEFSYATPEHNNLGLSLFSSYTYGTIDNVTQYVMNDNGEVVDQQELENDAMTEIPPFEATLSIYYKMFKQRFIPRFNIRMASAQNHVSQAAYESVSESFYVAGLSLTYQFNKFVYISTGVNNLFDAAYYEHLNRNIIGSSTNLYEPGRSFYFNLIFSF